MNEFNHLNSILNFQGVRVCQAELNFLPDMLVMVDFESHVKFWFKIHF